MNEYNDTRQPTHGLNLHRKKAAAGKETYVVEFCDVSGDKAFNNVHSACFYGASCAILMFDVTRKQSYLDLRYWFNKVRRHDPSIPCIVVANKIDVSYEAVQKKSFQFPSEHGLPFFFASAVDGTNCSKVFEEALVASVSRNRDDTKDFLSECLELFD